MVTRNREVKMQETKLLYLAWRKRKREKNIKLQTIKSSETFIKTSKINKQVKTNHKTAKGLKNVLKNIPTSE